MERIKTKLGNGLELTIHRVETKDNKVIWHCSLRNGKWIKWFEITFGENQRGMPTYNPRTLKTEMN